MEVLYIVDLVDDDTGQKGKRKNQLLGAHLDNAPPACSVVRVDVALFPGLLIEMGLVQSVYACARYSVKSL